MAIRIAALTGAAAFALTLTGPAAWAAGGGSTGSGSMPSDSAPQFDAAQEYRNGVTALQAERWSEAEKAFKRVLTVAPRDANTNLLLALSKLGRGDAKGARPYLEKAVKYDPRLVAAHVRLGVTLAKLGEAEKAQAELAALQASAQACGGTCPDAAALQQGIAEVQAAIAAGKQARLDPPQLDRFASAQSGDQAYLAAVSLINEHRYEAAIASLEQAQRAFGPHPDVLTYLGFANRKLRRYDLAEAYYRAALAIAPEHLGATEYYGEMMIERGDLAGARRMLAKLDRTCTFGCAQADELRRWIERGSSEG
jgi:Tfp pilus assembly protein PilF